VNRSLRTTTTTTTTLAGSWSCAQL